MLLPTRSVASELKEQASLGWKQLFLSGPTYQPVEEAWLVGSFLPKFKKMVGQLKINRNDESFDCDNFAELFHSELAVENHLAGLSGRGEVACGVILVQQQNPFGRVMSRPKGAHSLIMVRTENGWRVIEPQTLQVATLEKYPNRKNIENVYF